MPKVHDDTVYVYVDRNMAKFEQLSGYGVASPVIDEAVVGIFTPHRLPA
jgi:hypothetical protein